MRGGEVETVWGVQRGGYESSFTFEQECVNSTFVQQAGY
jgi:hypothetical protein